MNLEKQTSVSVETLVFILLLEKMYSLAWAYNFKVYPHPSDEVKRGPFLKEY